MGDPAVGKSAITQMFQSAGQRFPKVYNMTCGVEYGVKAVNVPDTEEAVELHIFDTAGQDVFAEQMPSYWENAKGVVLVYDVTRVHTLEACAIWYNRLLETLQIPSLPGVIVANKNDLRERAVFQVCKKSHLAKRLEKQLLDNRKLPYDTFHFPWC
jgi:transport family protein 27